MLEMQEVVGVEDEQRTRVAVIIGSTRTGRFGPTVAQWFAGLARQRTGLDVDAQIGYLRALETIRSAGIDVEDFAPLAATQLGHVVHATGDTAREVATRSHPRGPADLTEHAPMLDQLTELRHNQRLGTGDLDHIHDLVRQQIGLGRGQEGLTSILD